MWQKRSGATETTFPLASFAFLPHRTLLSLSFNPCAPLPCLPPVCCAHAPTRSVCGETITSCGCTGGRNWSARKNGKMRPFSPLSRSSSQRPGHACVRLLFKPPVCDIRTEEERERKVGNCEWKRKRDEPVGQIWQNSGQNCTHLGDFWTRKLCALTAGRWWCSDRLATALAITGGQSAEAAESWLADSTGPPTRLAGGRRAIAGSDRPPAPRAPTGSHTRH